MGNRPEPFVIPAGLTLDQAADGLSIEHEGDIILYGTLGQPLKRVRSSGGNVVLHVEVNLSEISAAGRVEIHGPATAEQISGAGVEIHGDASVSRLHAGEQGVIIRGDAKVHEIRSRGEVVVHGATDADSLSTEAGDVVLHGRARADFISADKGSVYLHGPATAHAVAVRGGDIVARAELEVEEATAVDGELAAESSVTARLLKAGRVALRGEQNTVGVVQGLHRISVGRGQIRSDILIAPRIELDPETGGKITVIECRNEPGPNSIKGGLSLADLAEFGVDAHKYLQDRGLAPLGEAGPGPQEGPAALSQPAPVARTQPPPRPAPAPEPAPEPEPDPEPEPAIAAEEPAASADTLVETLAADSLGEDEDLVEERSFSDQEEAEGAGPAIVDLFGDDDEEDNGVSRSGGHAPISVSLAEDDFEEDAFDDEEATHAADAAAEDSEVVELTASPGEEPEPAPASVSVGDGVSALDEDEEELGDEDELTSAPEDLVASPAPAAEPPLPSVDLDLSDLGEGLFAEDPTPAPEEPSAPSRPEPAAASGDNGADHSIEQIFDLTMEDEDSVAEEEDPIYAQMIDTVQRIEACYEGSELPPAVTQLNELIEARDYEAIRDDITNIWNRLLKFHQKRGLRIQPQVTTTFNTINTIVRKL